MKRPKVIFLDAVGTMFGVRGSVGEAYSAIASRFGVQVSAEVVNPAFYQSFKAAPPPVFLGAESQEIPDREFEWWKAIALSTFGQVGVLPQFSDFSNFFDELYAYFSTAEPWFVYPDVLIALEKWREMEIELGVLSNFDSRIYSVLQSLNLIEFFTSVTISSEIGAAKPNPKIFAAALEKHNCSPEEAWHIGDSHKEDYQGAKAAGLKGIFLKRTE
ncbi:HAD family hydrolase [Coleofasciculus sp. FACHB-712]|uniref:HAD-IA family hydrolase n=1 Tax=Coleofasciculus sp. FACHB-712 TaxID=2692789 RepID=UPI001689E21E|nr:HAD family hydrolase [Coleofasciculus sp. FACHB-712]MBD1942103.1 HAD family hydrolase [Coleofasciculus sp. FACHB-712]